MSQPPPATPPPAARNPPSWIGRVQARLPVLSPEMLVLLVSAWFLAASNGAFWAAARAGSSSTGVLVSLGVAVLALQAVLLALLGGGRLLKVLLAVLLVTTALASWYMQRYAVVFDTEMVRNVLHTDIAESRELMTAGMLLHALLWGVLPAALVLLVPLRRRTWWRGLLRRLLFIVAMVAVAAAAIGVSSQGVFSLVRSDTTLRYRITPGNYLVSLAKVVLPSASAPSGPRQLVGADARPAANAATRRPRLLVLVVGETVRGDHWGLNGYERQTTPELASREVVNFPEVMACGTSTEVSLPCMFSPQGRADYDRAAIRGSESVLDVLARAGVRVLWRDNQSGCKGTCVGVLSETMAATDGPALCAAGRCMDEILLQGLQSRIDATSGDALIVLHMLGNHGPNYFERYPARFARWTPVCTTAELSRCPRQDIVNAYDNAILYSDFVLGRLIDLLGAQPQRDTAMLYVSDHGESLGEYGLYLHGAPHAVAPRQQLHVPMTLWMSPGFVADDRIDLACLRQRAGKAASHDDLFSTLLGAFAVQTAAYNPARDLLATCRQA